MKNASTLRDLIDTSLDGEWGKGEPASDHVPMLCIRGTDFASARIGCLEGVPLRYVQAKKADRKVLRPFDIVMEVAGGTKNEITGRTLLVRPPLFQQSEHALTCASFSRFIRIRRDLCDPEYLFWFLQYLYASGKMHAYHTQHTGVARFQWTTFADREPVDLPPLAEQRRIAGVLSAYDDLIENCERRIRALDEMARSLYREWFVDFRFPGNPVQKLRTGAIPEGWSRSTVGEMASFLNRGIAPAYDDDGTLTVVNQKCIRDGRLNMASARKQTKPIPELRQLQVGDVLINSTGEGTLGRVAQVLAPLPNCTVDTHVTIVRSGPNVDPWFFGCAILGMQDRLGRMGLGATGQTELNRSAIEAIALLRPPASLQKVFASSVKPIRLLSQALQDRIANLRATRDLLLPRLLSGQLSVDDAA